MNWDALFNERSSGPASMSVSASSLIRWSGTENEQCLTLRNNFARGRWSAVAGEFRDMGITLSLNEISQIVLFRWKHVFLFWPAAWERRRNDLLCDAYWQNAIVREWSGHSSNQSKWGDWCALIEQNRAKAWLWFMRHTFAITTGMDFL